MKLNFFAIILSSINIAYSQNNYEFEFINEGIFSPCENYPNNYLDQLFDVTNLDIAQTEDGSLILNGYITLKTTVEKPLPVSFELFKFERGKWQPTVYSMKRGDACTSFFNKAEVWFPYLENTPAEELKCPFTAGQRIDFDIKKPTYVSLPIRNGEGEYKIHGKAGSENDDLFFCVDVFAMLHKV
ncbi:uncharacterized protein LOC119608736 [Lucilia sericata]|uniref:uncharacterized protein LOC119608736 n=1 Tax=Lucilia sericata TaxID=13632 RepID=UPI0018A851C9|nr:uncharacterized protein LOC119608736 [Lucilia sericata]